jgi:hypothetical protein
MQITQQSLSFKTRYEHQQSSVREQETLPTIAKAGQQDVSVSVHLQNRDEWGGSLSRSDLQKAAAKNRQPALSLPAGADAKLTKSKATAGTSAETTESDASQKTSNDESDDDLSLDSHTRLMKMLLESLFGAKIQLMHPIRQTADSGNGATSDASATASQQTAPVEPDHQVKITELIAENEQLRFAANGEVQTADGRTIKVNLGFAMSYQDLKLSERLTKQSALKDPLVINLEGQAAGLKEARFNFDLDGNGTKESLPTLSEGSYFLALDKNGNQQIDNGSELFGAQSGNGFAELAQYDEDGNGFIDAGDSIYGQLAVWRPGQGLTALAKVGVGAIYLHPVETQFQNVGSNTQGDSLGVLRSSSVYLKEDGSSGTIQQLDLRA